MDETIAAVATAPGRSCRSILRLSGEKAFLVAGRLVRSGPLPGALPGFAAPVAFVTPMTGLEVRARILVMRAPCSYTTEDMVEFHLVGSVPLAQQLLSECCRLGARPAEPGEFTRRAFLNGRIDDIQAEGVLALIESSSEAERAAAVERLRGHPTREAGEVRGRLLHLLAAIEAWLDFTDEDTESLDEGTVRHELDLCRQGLERIKAMVERRSPFRNLPSVVLLGPPNAGKSSLFRALIPGSEVIVSSVPGTTRDMIEGTVRRGETMFRLFDAPGVNDTDDPLERLAVASLQGMMDRIDASVVVMDGSAPPEPELLRRLHQFSGPRRMIYALNKSDRGRDPGWNEIGLSAESFAISARYASGLAPLLDSLSGILPGPMGGDAFSVGAVLGSKIGGAVAAIEEALEGDWAGGLELVALEIRSAFDALSDIGGRLTGDELLDALFSRFCIGK